MCHYAPFLLSYKKITQQHLSEQAHAIFQATAQTFVQTVKSPLSSNYASKKLLSSWNNAFADGMKKYFAKLK